ncbi:Pyrrolidone-carboxylate peptidase [Alteracholeplasma palmae J233]|uniref:Pyroglutamyl-peptidase I n=1 Tax=Alteracholeplasma palmae (strain ATCC 49389 / J233) TaxID=1318466 RepID=U4KJU5_ALTPJ|nr:pyrrolidone-carboxylate peptidase [Alteracholeplasma palmae]CCV63727.1 Pyrrolidone-carboxylate peptidase [Alteracholeplasma palmae J233]
MKKVLVTAFAPFNMRNENESEEVLKQIDSKFNEGIVIKKFLPTAFYNSFEEVKKVIDKEKIDVIILLGEASKRSMISIEKIAYNEIKTDIPDNNGKVLNQKIFEDGEDKYYANFSPMKIKELFDTKKIPSYVSEDAGRYVCNSLLYSVMHYQIQKDDIAPTTFIHLPISKNEEERNKLVFAINYLISRLFNE